MNLFGTVLTYSAPSANYRGESELNRSVIQKVTDGRFDYPIISPEAVRNALRETLAAYGLPCNRKRLHDEEQLAVHHDSLPDPDKYADDFLFGYLVAADGKKREQIRKQAARADFTFKRDSVLRMNLAKGLEPYRHNAVFTQSPLSSKDSAYKNADSSALLHRETAVTAFQYPFALNLDDCAKKPDWAKALLKAIGELNNVAGNHARSYFEMAPASIVLRLTKRLVAGYRTYGFEPDRAVANRFLLPEVVGGLLHDAADGVPAPDYPGDEFILGGCLVKEMPDAQAKKLQERGVALERDPRRALEIAATRGLGG